MTAPGLSAFLHGDRGNDECGDRVGAGPAEQAVEQQADQQNAGQVRAQQGLLGVRDGAA
jgi:hypothetical protein